MTLWYWHHGVSNDSDIIPTIYVDHTSKLNKHLLIDYLLFLADAGNYASYWYQQCCCDTNTMVPAMNVVSYQLSTQLIHQLGMRLLINNFYCFNWWWHLCPDASTVNITMLLILWCQQWWQNHTNHLHRLYIKIGHQLTTSFVSLLSRLLLEWCMELSPKEICVPHFTCMAYLSGTYMENVCAYLPLTKSLASTMWSWAW